MDFKKKWKKISKIRNIINTIISYLKSNQIIFKVRKYITYLLLC